MRLVALAMGLLAAAPAIAVEDTARIGLREDGGKPLAAFQLRLPQTIVIMQAPVTMLGGHSIEIRREIAPSISLGGTYRYSLGERFVSERFGLKLTVTR